MTKRENEITCVSEIKCNVKKRTRIGTQFHFFKMLQATIKTAADPFYDHDYVYYCLTLSAYYCSHLLLLILYYVQSSGKNVISTCRCFCRL